MEPKISYTIQGIITVVYLLTVIPIMCAGNIKYPLFAIILGCCFLVCALLQYLVVFIIEIYVEKLNKKLSDTKQDIIKCELRSGWYECKIYAICDILHIKQTGTWRNRTHKIIKRLKTIEER